MIGALRYKLDLQMFAFGGVTTFIFDEGVENVESAGNFSITSSGETTYTEWVTQSKNIIITLKEGFAVSSITSSNSNSPITIISDTSFSVDDNSDMVGGDDNTITITTTKTGGGVVWLNK